MMPNPVALARSYVAFLADFIRPGLRDMVVQVLHCLYAGVILQDVPLAPRLFDGENRVLDAQFSGVSLTLDEQQMAECSQSGGFGTSWSYGSASLDHAGGSIEDTSPVGSKIGWFVLVGGECEGTVTEIMARVGTTTATAIIHRLVAIPGSRMVPSWKLSLPVQTLHVPESSRA